MSAHPSDIVIVIPVYCDDVALLSLLNRLDELSQSFAAAPQSPAIARVVVDGAAQPSTEALVSGRATYLNSKAGRGKQIAAGISTCEASWVWVLHADTVVSEQAFSYMLQLVARALPVWGRFDVQLEGLAIVAWFMNWRSRLSRICTGDQAMFFSAEMLRSVGGFPAQPLMEDIEVSKRLKRSSGEFQAPHVAVQSSPRRWQQHGVLRTVGLMWWTRLRYFFGVSAEALYADYYGTPR